MIRTVVTWILLLTSTVVLGTLVLLAQLFRVPHGERSVYNQAPQWWARLLLWSSGTKVVLHRDGGEASAPGSRVYIANHVSWFDILAMVRVLPQYGFVAKRELERIPVFGPAARAVGVIYIDRDNRKAAFGAYEDAAAKIRGGQSVIVYPEGTRSTTYTLRTFKKGPFVLAISAQVPVVPVAIYGTIEVNGRGSLMVRPGTVHVHMLEEVPTAGMTYDDRNVLARTVHNRIATLLNNEYGVPVAGAASGTAGATGGTTDAAGTSGTKVISGHAPA